MINAGSRGPRLCTADPPEKETSAWVPVLPARTNPVVKPFSEIGLVRSMALQAPPATRSIVATIGEGLPVVAHCVDQVEGQYVTVACVCVIAEPDTVTDTMGAFTMPRNNVVPGGGVKPGATNAGSTSFS
jgi:hypothetical protein